MAAAAPLAAPTATPPVGKSPSAPVPAPKSLRTGQVDDRGVSCRDTIHAQRWTLNGLAKVVHEADVGTADLEGSVTVGGQVTADSFRVIGTFDCGAGVEVATRLETDGVTRIVGTLRTGEALVRGTTRVGGALGVDRLLRFRGSLSAPSAHAGAFLGSGALEIDGELSAGEVDVTFDGPSHLGTLRSPSVRLVLRAPNPVQMVLGRELRVSVDRIEADRVELEGVDVDFVRSGRITLGRDAHLTAYEGTIVARHRSARVGPRSQSPRPHGLSR